MSPVFDPNLTEGLERIPLREKKLTCSTAALRELREETGYGDGKGGGGVTVGEVSDVLVKDPG